MSNDFMEQTGIKTPMLDEFRDPVLTNKSVFRLRVEDLALFFTKKNVAKPENTGETRIALKVLKSCGYNTGLCTLLSTDENNGIVGDKDDIERRQAEFGKNSIALPSIPSFETFMSR